jgi:uncharacterized DUF497 family protein
MDEFPEKLAGSTGFDRDEGKVDKNWERHEVSAAASEQIFFQRPILVAPDREHSQDEKRYAALGKTAADRQLTIVFTIRSTLIRVISARDMSRRERRVYERA